MEAGFTSCRDLNGVRRTGSSFQRDIDVIFPTKRFIKMHLEEFKGFNYRYWQIIEAKNSTIIILTFSKENQERALVD